MGGEFHNQVQKNVNLLVNIRTASKVFDLGTLNLETIFANEERELIVSRKRRGQHMFGAKEFFEHF